MPKIEVPIVGLISHTRRVQHLYKRAIRTLQAYYDRRPAFRYQAVLMRDRFDKNEKICLSEAKNLISKGEEELFSKQHWNPIIFPKSPGGSCYGREVIPPDWVIDYWHPLEKAQYPHYFACREKRKEEYIEMWEKKYGKPDPESH